MSSLTPLEQIKNNVKNFVPLKEVEITRHNFYISRISRDITKCNYKPPYTNDEILNFENSNNIILPDELKLYLTEVTRSIFWLRENTGSTFCDIELDKKRIKQMPIKRAVQNNGIYISDSGSNMNIKGDTKVFKLRDIGCGYTNFIILEGDNKGEIWCELFAGDGLMYMINKSFLNYIISNKTM